jgi:two-component system chemotaxis response regulator CheB
MANSFNRDKIVLIGASTGGPGHLRAILAPLPSTLKTPIVIAQHMNAVFISSFVQQFKTELKAPVLNANQALHVDRGGVYICERNCSFNASIPPMLSFDDPCEPTLYNPSIDHLFFSAVPLCGTMDILAILLTGIGHDGALGLQALHKAGAKCYAESEETAIVYGMPKRAKELIPDLTMLPLAEIHTILQRFC